jgi:tetratricopeptide (TPR) repeat protein/predicted aspartyl protease
MNRRLVLAALTAALALTAGAVPALAACKLDTFAELPVTMNGAPVVAAKINGAEARFTVDSGSFFSTLTLAAAAQYGLKLKRAPYDTLRGVGGDTEVSMTTVDDFAVAGGRVKNVAFLVAHNAISGGNAGVLGQNFLSIADVEYDFANGEIRLMRPSDCAGHVLAYWRKAGQPYGLLSIDATEGTRTSGRATVNGRPVTVMFDTGSPGSMLSLAAARRVGVADAAMVEVGGIGGVGPHFVRSWIAPVESFEIGGEKVEHTRLRIADMPQLSTDMVIGADFFLSHRVYVANSQNRLYFTYNGGPVADLTSTGAPLKNVPAAAEAATSDAPTDAPGFARRGAALASRRQFAAAIADLTKAIELDPKSPVYLYERGQILRVSGQGVQAMADFNAALVLSPDYAPVRMARAELRLTSPDKSGALEDLDVAARVFAKQADARLTLAELYQRFDALPAAIGQYDLWIDSHGGDPRRAGALNGRCWARSLLGSDLDQALTDCNAALKLTPGSFHILDSRGLVRLRRGEYDLAIADYDAVLAAAPRTAWSLYGRGLARLKQGKSVEGAADLAAARAIDPAIAKTAAKYGVGP